eukprot:PITA_06115
MDEFINRFTSLLRYVTYLKEEKAKVQRFVSGLPMYMRERIEFDNPKSMDEAIRKARICYQQSKQKGDSSNRKWNEKKNSKAVGNNKGSRSSGIKGSNKNQNNRAAPRSAFRAKSIGESRMSEPPAKMDTEGSSRPPVQCWGCGGPHYVKNCPQRKGTDQISQIHEASTVGDVGRSMPRINAALDDRRAEYQPTMVEFEVSYRDQKTSNGKGQKLSYSDSRTASSGRPERASHLGSYDVLIGMDWLEKHWALVNCKTKVIRYRDEAGIEQDMQGIKRPVQIRPITASQLAKCIWNRCQVYAIQAGYAETKNKENPLEHLPVIKEFADVFPEEIPGLPPKRDIDFTIELIPGAAPVSRTPYRMSVPELTELKMQLQELLDKNYIHPSVSPWGALVLLSERRMELLECVLITGN